MSGSLSEEITRFVESALEIRAEREIGELRFTQVCEGLCYCVRPPSAIGRLAHPLFGCQPDGLLTPDSYQELSDTVSR